ncbi:hypothetical protein SCAR479_13422 [Seiridium cardinale]|uniref:Uncharacterized protein n=1 Tax=Seiridium cardinale TaxID=138064 RepID=A0ABR2X7Z7_9PEZI
MGEEVHFLDWLDGRVTNGGRFLLATANTWRCHAVCLKSAYTAIWSPFPQVRSHFDDVGYYCCVVVLGREEPQWTIKYAARFFRVREMLLLDDGKVEDLVLEPGIVGVSLNLPPLP